MVSTANLHGFKGTEHHCNVDGLSHLPLSTTEEVSILWSSRSVLYSCGEPAAQNATESLAYAMTNPKPAMLFMNQNLRSRIDLLKIFESWKEKQTVQPLTSKGCKRWKLDRKSKQDFLKNVTSHVCYGCWKARYLEASCGSDFRYAQKNQCFAIFRLAPNCWSEHSHAKDVFARRLGSIPKPFCHWDYSTALETLHCYMQSTPKETGVMIYFDLIWPIYVFKIKVKKWRKAKCIFPLAQWQASSVFHITCALILITSIHPSRRKTWKCLCYDFNFNSSSNLSLLISNWALGFWPHTLVFKTYFHSKRVWKVH